MLNTSVFFHFDKHSTVCMVNFNVIVHHLPYVSMKFIPQSRAVVFLFLLEQLEIYYMYKCNLLI